MKNWLPQLHLEYGH